MTEKLTPYDPAEDLVSDQGIADFMAGAFETNDAAFIAHALGIVARAKGMAQVAQDAGLSRESLYKALSGERSPGFDTILKVLRALGLKLHAEPTRRIAAPKSKRPRSFNRSAA